MQHYAVRLSNYPDRDITTMPERYCVVCGKSDEQTGFRSTKAIRCRSCDQEANERRKRWNRGYQQARYAATSTLIDRHREEYEDLLEAEIERRTEGGELAPLEDGEGQ